MLKAKSRLCKYIKDRAKEIVFEKQVTKALVYYVNNKYDLPTGIIMDIIAGRTEVDYFNEFILFCVLDGIDHVDKADAKSEYYTKIEIDGYSRTKYEDKDKIKFPIRIKCVQIDKDQWVGATDVHFLMQLRKAQLINYNANAQRTMKKIIRGDKTAFKISLNVNAVKSIKQSYLNHSFVPNTITLNIPEETEYNFYYDSNSCELVIDSLEHFDISDGYHRYIAICQIIDSGADFDYNMELRIINFPVDRVRQFIYQEDQKTKMRKIDSASMNMNSAANMVVERLNIDPRFNMKDKINRNDGLINYSELAALIQYFYLKGIKDPSVKEIISIKDDLRDKINYFTETFTDYLDHRFDYLDLAIMIYRFRQMNEGYGSSPDEAQKIKRMIERKGDIPRNVIHKENPIKSFVKELEKIDY